MGQRRSRSLAEQPTGIQQIDWHPVKTLQIRPVRSVAILATLTIVIILLSSSYLVLNLRARELRHAHQETQGLAQMLMDQTEKNFVGVDLILQGVQERRTVR